MKVYCLLVVLFVVSLYLPEYGAVPIPITVWNGTDCSDGTGVSVQSSNTSCVPITFGSRTVYASSSCQLPQGMISVLYFNSSSCDSNTVAFGYLTPLCNQVAPLGPDFPEWSATTISGVCVNPPDTSDSFTTRQSPLGICILLVLAISALIA